VILIRLLNLLGIETYDHYFDTRHVRRGRHWKKDINFSFGVQLNGWIWAAAVRKRDLSTWTLFPVPCENRLNLSLSEAGNIWPHSFSATAVPIETGKLYFAYTCRLPPTAVRNHERLPQHGLYRATSSMTSRGQIWHILNIASSFSATLFWPNFQ
jgi:hypothetical protein